MSKSNKGSAFERKICKQLSLWWTNGSRNDVFWRTAGSGAMAKTRSKKGGVAFGQYGDVQATDPCAQPFIDLFSIELKRGYSKDNLQNIIDKPKTAAKQTYEKFIEQAKKDAKNAGAYDWLLIIKRNRREPLVVSSLKIYKEFLKKHIKKTDNIIINTGKNTYIAIKLDDFLKIKPTVFSEFDIFA